MFLIALGAILTFAVDWTVGGLDLKAVGWILMVVGVGGLMLYFFFWGRRRTPNAVAIVRQRQATEVPPTFSEQLPPSHTDSR